MADTQIEIQEQILKHRVSDFFTKETQTRKPLQSVLKHVSDNQYCAYLFGGVARDLLMHGLKARVRDVDIVIDSGAFPHMERTMAPYLKRRTRFGGLHLEHQGWLFDMWSLTGTWAFREGHVSGADFADLPRTTFLNVEAVAVELTSGRGQKRKVYSHGFYEAFLNRKIEINLEANPYPALCVVRSLLTACKLNFTMGPRLTRYIVHYANRIEIEELLQVQQSHYGRVMLNEQVLQSWLNAIEEQYRIDKTGNVHLPCFSIQLALFPSILTEGSSSRPQLSQRKPLHATGSAMHDRLTARLKAISLQLPLPYPVKDEQND